MSDELLIKCGSPTLAGLKTGNMFSYAYESREEVNRDLRRLNRILVPRGLRVLPLRYNEKTVLLYLYRTYTTDEGTVNRLILEQYENFSDRGGRTTWI